MHAGGAGIAYLDGPRLRRSILAAADWVEAAREELNRINVFPVPDGDTGTNFAFTLRAAAEGVRALPGAALPEVTRVMAEACVFQARGNSGMLLSHFLVGFRETLGDCRAAYASDVARAFRGGADHLLRGLDEPVEGTILTVCREAADAAEAAAARTGDLVEFMRRVLIRAQDSLARTPDLLAALKEAGVVDAGAKGFVRLLEGVVKLIEGDPFVAVEPPVFAVPDASALAEIAIDRDFQFCTEVLVRGTDLPGTTGVRASLRKLGGSIVVLSTGDLLKVHVHTDAPDEVFALARGWGSIESTKADDMREQHRERGALRRRIGIVADSTCDLPDELIDKHRIVVVPVQVVSGEHSWLDRVEIASDEIYDRMRNSGTVFTTSQPAPGAFIRGFEDALAGADEAIGLFVGGKISGTVASAVRAVEAKQLSAVSIFDSRSASWGMGLLALKAAELAEEGWSREDILAELGRIRDQSGGLFTVDIFDNLLRSGRVGRGRAWLGGLLDIKPILEVTTDGRVVPLDRVRGRDALLPRVLHHLDARLTPRPDILRMAVVHAGEPALAERIRDAIVERYQPAACHLGLITAAIGVHTGPGAWGVFFQIEDRPATA